MKSRYHVYLGEQVEEAKSCVDELMHASVEFQFMSGFTATLLTFSGSENHVDRTIHLRRMDKGMIRAMVESRYLLTQRLNRRRMVETDL